METLAANWMHRLGLAGLSITLVCFLLYGLGIPETEMTMSQSAEYWDKPMENLRNAVDTDEQRRLLLKIPGSASPSVAALAILVSTPLPTLLVLAIVWCRRKDLFFALTTMGIVIILVCASLDILSIL